MTAKEALREKIDDLTEPEAEHILLQVEAQLAARSQRRGGAERSTALPYSGPTALDLFNDIQELFRDVPAEAWEGLPSPADIDEVLYADLERRLRRSKRPE